MDRIDLTTDNVFTTKKGDIGSILKKVTGVVSDNIYQPLVKRSFKHNQDYHLESELNLFTGTRLEIIRSIEINEVVNGNLCERCGKKSHSLTLTALCENCEHIMNLESEVGEAFKYLELHKLRRNKNSNRIIDIDERSTYLFLFIESD